MLSIKSPRTLQTLEIKESINQHKKNKYTYQVAEGGSLLLFVCLVIQLGCVCVSFVCLWFRVVLLSMPFAGFSVGIHKPHIKQSSKQQQRHDPQGQALFSFQSCLCVVECQVRERSYHKKGLCIKSRCGSHAVFVCSVIVFLKYIG